MSWSHLVTITCSFFTQLKVPIIYFGIGFSPEICFTLLFSLLSGDASQNGKAQRLPEG